MAVLRRLGDVVSLMLAFDPEQVVGGGNLAEGRLEIDDDLAEIGRIPGNQLEFVALHPAERLRLGHVFFLYALLHVTNLCLPNSLCRAKTGRPRGNCCDISSNPIVQTATLEGTDCPARIPDK